VAHEEEGGQPIRGTAAAEQREIVACIGPEGGFTAEEVGRAVASGFQTVSLGSRRLRTETAAMLVAGLLLVEA
jgi:16S rRNA (uracil1498-N3)-methyltransferase